MTILAATQTAIVNITVPGSYLTITCATGEVMQVDWVSPGSITGTRIVRQVTEDVGPFADSTVVTLRAIMGNPQYTDGLGGGLTTAQVAAVQGLVSGAGNGLRNKTQFQIADTSSAAGWTISGAGVTITSDTAVTFNGKPSLRVFIPAATTGTVYIQRTAADCQMPSAWDGQGLYWGSLVSDSSRFTQTLFFLGDLGLTNHYFASCTPTTQESNLYYAANEWVVHNAGWSNAWTIGGGTPTFIGAKQARLQFASVTAGSDMFVWIADIGILARRKPSVIWTMDDNWKSQAEYIVPAALYHGISVSLSIIPPSQGGIGAGYSFSEAVLRSYADDKTGRIALITHAQNSVAVDGDALYVSKAVATREYLKSLGVGDEANYHAWVQNTPSAGAMAGMIAAGFKGARGGTRTGAVYTWLPDGLLSAGHKRRMAFNLSIQCDSGMTLATAKSNWDACKAAGRPCVVMAHDVASSASALAWTYSDITDLMAYIAADISAGVADSHTMPSLLAAGR